ncbi:hypothetical protein SAMN05216456_3030 [Devosia crocina]|uniref:LPS-assembly lipoprotein n=1 Tax=Devosia crocina TaxID=429728 RepID=A0A1I7NST0_9HYPH|nr:hypothetical protein [Devosia crocina]SFV37648.1 hypothetical protein SAMN05216456_3030 [Devosia crocina]
MSWSRLKPLVVTTALLLASAAVGACSFQPVYSGRLAENARLELAYASPATRLEQIVYQDLAFRLGEVESPTAPLVSVTVSAGLFEPFLSATADPNKLREANIVGVLTITPRDGKGGAPITITRSARAQYTHSGQVTADKASEIEAQERGARAVAQSLRLAVLAALGSQ